ncbi:DUF4126 family protein [Acidobacteria bacterium AB60]|nr:DUF4126 family protein [Acidobacteria bacterium AB60]
MVALSAVMLGVVAGLRSMLAPCVVSWAAWLGILNVDKSPVAFMGFHWTHIILSVLAAGELIADKLPFVPSRKAVGPFLVRIVSGALCGATIGAVHDGLVAYAALGAAGAIAGTLGGAAVRARLARAFRRDWPAALLEDCAGIAIAVFLVQAMRQG